MDVNVFALALHEAERDSAGENFKEWGNLTDEEKSAYISTANQLNGMGIGYVGAVSGWGISPPPPRDVSKKTVK